ncbi:MAG: hypothetical protein AAB368_05200, partial [bacterium]
MPPEFKETLPAEGEELHDPTVEAAREILRTADARAAEQIVEKLEHGLREIEKKEAAGEIGEIVQLLHNEDWMTQAYETLRDEKQWGTIDFRIRLETLEAALSAVAISIQALMRSEQSSNLVFDVNKMLGSAVEHALGKQAFLEIAPLYGMVMEDLREKWSTSEQD